MEQRPKLIIQNTKFDTTIILTIYSLLTTLFIGTFFIYKAAPAIIPTHFKIDGTIDNYGDKATLFILPTIGMAVTMLLQWLCKYPHLFNYPQSINETNAAALYQQGIRLLRWVNLSVLVLIFFLQYEICNSIFKSTAHIKIWYVIILLLTTTLLPIVIAYKMDNKKIN